MRISDWSSDVCSSDLDVRTTIETDDGALIYTHYVGIGDMGVDGHARFLAGELPPKLVLRTGPRFSTAHPKSGSASCRERVCQYVSISVIAVSLKKTHHTIY